MASAGGLPRHQLDLDPDGARIKRRDPTRPAFWCASYTPPHPPLVPLQTYVDYYRQFEIPAALRGDWSEGPALPLPLQMNRAYYGGYQARC